MGKISGQQTVTGTYSGDDVSLVAPTAATFAFTAVTPPLASDGPPVVGVAKATTSTSVACGSPVAYRHHTRCLVTVKAGVGGSAAVPAGSVRLAPLAGQRPFAAQSCSLNSKGQCMVDLTVNSLPGSIVSMSATYAGGAGFLGSTGLGRLAVRAVGTSVTVRCSHPSVGVGSVVHCVASVRTEFGAAAAVPAFHKSQVTVTAHGDVIAYDGGRGCHWRRAGNGLTCAFSVKAGALRGSRTIHVYYAGDHATQDAASKGATTFRVR